MVDLGESVVAGIHALNAELFRIAAALEETRWMGVCLVTT